MFNKIRHTLAYQLLIIVFAIYFFISVSITLGHMAMEYRSEKDRVINELTLLQKAFEGGLSTSLFDLNNEQLWSIIEGIYNVPILIGIKIEATSLQIPVEAVAFGSIINAEGIRVDIDRQGRQQVSDELVESLILHSFPIFQPETDIAIASATLYTSEAVIFSNVRDGYIRIVISAIVKTFSLWALFLWAAGGRLNKPLRKMAADVAQLNLDSLDKAQIHIQTKSHNELNILVQAFNEMIQNLSQAQKKLYDYAETLEQKNQQLLEFSLGLENKVSERTQELKKTLSQLEEKHHQLEAANKAKCIFLANMSHEIRTPLNAILGFSEMMQIDSTLPQQELQYLGIINKSGNHLLQLINDVLEMSKIEAGRSVVTIKTCDFKAILKNVENMFRIDATRKGLDLIFYGVDKLPDAIQCDEGKVRQILVNLLGNAIKFTHEGHIFCRIHFDFFEIDGLSFVIDIEDTGKGIGRHEMHKVFSLFEQTTSGISERNGTGLGLAISREYARLLRGDINFSSELNVGSVFTFTFKANLGKACELPDKTLPISHIKKQESEFKILIVDDIEDNLLMLESLLVPVGFSIIKADNGSQCIDMFHQHKPNLVLMDLRMPELDGFETIEIIRRGDKITPIIAVSASMLNDERKKALHKGANDFMMKPIGRESLLMLMAKHLSIEYEKVGRSARISDASNDQTVTMSDQTQTNRILIIDDVKPNRLLLSTFLCKEGFQCKEAENGVEALKLLHAWNPDFMLLDLHMPVMDGYEVLQQLQALPKQTLKPIVFALSADEDNQEKTDELLSLGASAVFSKPVKLSLLLAHILEYKSGHNSGL
ncbi:MAG: response regulator [Pseudomonadales bacterium]|nr:response regulator [Pseudomonadales bacterium]